MIINDFYKIEFSFESFETIVFDKKDINHIVINDNFVQIGKDLLRKVTISIKTDAKAIEWWPDSADDNSFIDYSKNPLARFEKSRGYGDITEITIYQERNIKRKIYSHWSDTDNAYNRWIAFNLYQHEGFETDADMNLTGNYEVSFYSPIRKIYEFLQDDDLGFALFSLSPEETGLDYRLAFVCHRPPHRFNIFFGCLLIDTGDQYLPIEFEYDELPIRNVWMEEIKHFETEKIDMIRKYIQKNIKVIKDHYYGVINDSELLKLLETI